MSTAGSNERSMAYLRRQGYLVGKVEKWNPHAGPCGIRQDLWGFIDVLAVRAGETLAVQTTTYAQVTKHLQKLADPEIAARVEAVRKAGWKVVVHGWKKSRVKRGRWRLRELEVGPSFLGVPVIPLEGELEVEDGP